MKDDEGVIWCGSHEAVFVKLPIIITISNSIICIQILVCNKILFFELFIDDVNKTFISNNRIYSSSNLCLSFNKGIFFFFNN